MKPRRLPGRRQRYLDINGWRFVVTKKPLRVLDAGDWHERTKRIVVPKSDPLTETALALHEITEAVLCLAWGVRGDEVDRLDRKGQWGQGGLRAAHNKALAIERYLVESCGRTWREHEKLVDQIYDRQSNLRRNGKATAGTKRTRNTTTHKGPRCPKCKSADVIPIEYGMPTPEAEQMERDGKLKLAGCVMGAYNPDAHCKSCGHEWTTMSQ